ncbi:MAG: MBL fold metallo-hydrolase [Candidatus Staskawiczbacteria bacterium]|nr:MBL fold metallo-hydrolase [Candidatus Staskawiczbacteria bacterium]
MKITFLGTNGWFDTKTGNTICTLIETKDYFIVLDAGNGFYKLDEYIKNEKPIYLFLSHFHLDHIVGLHAKNKFNFKQGIKIYGQKGVKDILEKIINQPFTVPFKHEWMSFDMEVHDLFEQNNNLPFFVEFKPLFHWSPCLGFRFKLEDKIISYCTDTGPCENLLELSKDSDLLITECSFRINEYYNPQTHLNPGLAAEIGKKSNVKNLALTHFDAYRYKTIEQRKEAEEFAKKIFENTFVATDDMQIEI